MNQKLIGAFVFANQGYGILNGVYNNCIETMPFPESAKRKKDSEPSEDLFEGIYTTIWLEKGGVEDKTDLKIEKLKDNSYKLTWYVSSKVYYNGQAFIRNNELIGSYWEII